MKLLAVNGSPRLNRNTARLLEQVAAGATSRGEEAELVHLRGLRYSGCISCFACKRIGGPSYGRCPVQDDLAPVLQKAHEADVLVLGTPFYFSAESAFMRGFQERLFFQYHRYLVSEPPLSPRKKATALVYTMNIDQESMPRHGYDRVVGTAKYLMEHLFGPCEVLLACDTLQFDDYSLYENDMFDADAKRRRHEEVFPKELEAAFELGARLVT